MAIESFFVEVDVISAHANKAPAAKLCTTLAVLALTACGGGGSDEGTPTAPVQTPQNSAPVISGTPGTTVTAGQAYSFQPSASDADNDSLTFSIVNKPAWASFNASNGRLSGTPTTTGTAADIRISVSDGKTSVAMTAFSITVSQSGGGGGGTTGAVTLDWTPPSANTDGSTLSNLAGFRIAYGRSAAQLDRSISVTNPSVSSYVVENLASATWYFTVSSINSSGVESVPSMPVEAIVP